MKALITQAKFRISRNVLLEYKKTDILILLEQNDVSISRKKKGIKMISSAAREIHNGSYKSSDLVKYLIFPWFISQIGTFLYLIVIVAVMVLISGFACVIHGLVKRKKGYKGRK